jgi:hypothetical protein
MIVSRLKKIHIFQLNVSCFQESAGIKDYKCEQCDYASGNKGHLTIHVKAAYEALKNNRCKQCNYATGVKSNLIQHIKGS